MDLQTKKYLLFASITAGTIGVLYLNRSFVYSLRQRFLAKTFQKEKKGHGHSHGHSHGSHSSFNMDALKEALFRHFGPILADCKVSSVPELKSGHDGIRIVEIGVGSGTNFKYFPTKCLFIAVDPNPFFEDDVKENLSKYPGIKLERRLITGVEDMSEIPDNSVDVLLGTMVFCQVKDIEKTFREILRVLVPGGKFYFMDHLAADKGSATHLLQLFLTYSGIARVFLNAHLDRDIGKDIQQSAFRNVDHKYIKSGKTNMVIGVAEK